MIRTAQPPAAMLPLSDKLAELWPDLSAQQREFLQTRASETLNELAADEALRVRATLAEMIKDMPGVPHALVLMLASDAERLVCEPVLRLSPLLTTDDLLGLLAATPSPATATAIAGRNGLSEAVSDAVAATADTAAIAALLGNRTAAIRESTLDALIARATEIVEWHGPLVRRPRLTARAARALSGFVATQLLGEFADRGDLGDALSGELRQRLEDRLQQPQAAAKPVAPSRDAALTVARQLYADARLDEDALVKMLRKGDIRMATAMLAVAADVELAVVERSANLRSAKGLISLVWKAGFGMRVAGPVQAMLARIDPKAQMRATASGGFPLSVDEMRWQLEFLSGRGR